MTPEVSVQEAWRLIEEKHKRLAAQEFRVFQQTGFLDVIEEGDIPVAFKLTTVGDKSVIFNYERRVFLVNDAVLGDLSKNEAELLAMILIHPHVVQTYAQLYPHFYPDDAERRSSWYYAEYFRPTISRLRKELSGVDKTLSNIIETIRGTGYVYIPHWSLKDRETGGH